ncbi:MAG: VCBS domain-containing protein [Afipia sp.]|nr:VCBS domain-containing protein [Afipia sp.]
MNYSGPFDANALGHSAASLNGDGFSFGLKPAFIQHHSSDAHVVVPDAHLLFSGNYTRIGSDLIIADADHKLVVGGYFKGDTRPTLMSSDGAALSGQIVEALTGHVHYAQAASPAPAAQVIGHVLKMSGSASAIRNGVSIELHIGDAVQKGDVIQTGSDSSIGMTFIDGSAFGMTSNARMVLNEMIYDPNGSSNSSLMSLVQGTITFVAGQTAKNGNMRVDTPVATMGIRGTAVLVEIGADNGPTKFSVLVEPDGHTGSYNLYDKSTGQLIGTVSQAGQVTFVSIGGIGQPPSAVEQLKTMQDQQQEKALIQQVFQLYFPNYNPDNSNPKTQKFGSTSYNNLAEITFTTNNFNNQTFLTQIELRIAVTDPHTGVTTYQNRLFFNTKAIFSADSVFGDQAFTPTIQTFKFQDVVHINDPDIGNAPFYDIGVPFVAGSAVIKSAESSISNVSEAFLKSLIHIDQTTGQVTFDRQQLNFLDDGQTVTIKIQVTATSGPDTGHVIVPITITGANDAPTIVLGDPQHPSVIAGAVTEDTPANASSLAADGVISFQDVDLTDAHTASVALTSTASTLPGFVANTTKIGTFTIDPVSENLTDADNHGSVGWHFTLDDNDPTLQSLAKGQTITQTYTITITDDNGVPVTQTVTITITGTNDAPVLTADVAAGNPVLHYTDERQDRTGDTIADTACGTLSFTDVDLTDTHVASAALDADTTTSIVWSGHSASSLPAGLRAALQNAVSVSVIDSTNTGAGTVHWDFSASDELFDFLGKNETLTLTYNVTVADYYHDAGGAHLAGTSSTQTITIVIGAANDQPVILATSTLADAITETETQTGDASSTAAHTATGIVKYADVDIVDVHSISQTGSTGTWTDTHGVSHNITDAAIIDPSHLVFGTVDQNGNTVGWSYTVADNALDFLAADEKLVVTYDVIVQDSSGADNGTSTTKQITITITGTNDVPVFTSEDVSGVINETSGTPVVNAAALTDSGIIKFTDVDLSDTHAVSATGTFVPVTPGDVALGTLTAVLDSDIDHTTGSSTSRQASTSSSNSRLRSMTGRAPRSPRRSR